MKNQKRILGAAAMACIVAGTLAGCGNSGTDKAESSAVVSSEAGKKRGIYRRRKCNGINLLVLLDRQNSGK